VDGIEGEFDLADITAPSLLVSGAHDLPDFAEIADHLHAVIDGSRRVRLDWAGHLPNLERPAEFTELIRGFLAEQRGATSA
ncbi:MAG TPA: alpha/beta hydrolase, partial [Stackebrandtia sp.]|jgi:pimeloyl-ACP methyl ester carboxylesterase|uniref:alpha/beta fold hydrolase n=1 Tax=Stackebrandtia sp. TaxID=2023065 RepID=UPI002D3D9AC8